MSRPIPFYSYHFNEDSLPSDIISACNPKLFNEHLLDTHLYKFCEW